MRALGACLRPGLADEVDRLYALEATHAALVAQLADARLQLTRSTALTGHLRERLIRAERRLEDLDVEEISKARRAALFLGDGFIRITSTGRGRFTTEHVASDRVTIRGH